MGIEAGDSFEKPKVGEQSVAFHTERPQFGDSNKQFNAVELSRQTDEVRKFNETFDPKNFSAEQIQTKLASNEEQIKALMQRISSRTMDLNKHQDKDKASNLLGDVQLI